MKSASFQDRMKMLAKTAESKSSDVTVGINLSRQVMEPIARMARATESTMRSVLEDFLLENNPDLHKIADDVEQFAPKNRLDRPLYSKHNKRNNALDLKHVKAFALKSKKNGKGAQV